MRCWVVGEGGWVGGWVGGWANVLLTSTFQERSTWLALEIHPSQERTGFPPPTPSTELNTLRLPLAVEEKMSIFTPARLLVCLVEEEAAVWVGGWVGG